MEQYFSPSFYMALFRIYLTLKWVFDSVYSVTVKTTRRALMLTQPQEYVFFSGYTTPYLASTVSTIGPGVPPVSWVYNLETNILSNSTNEPLKNIPWLSASIRFNGLNLYSLDDFISEIKYASESDVPCPAVIVGAWSLRTGIVLDNQVELELCIITEEGDEIVLSPWSLVPFTSTSSFTSDAPMPLITNIGYEPMFVELREDGRTVTLKEEELDDMPNLDE
jgi:hypothetical protein